jgi:hypothetical protein
VSMDRVQRTAIGEIRDNGPSGRLSGRGCGTYTILLGKHDQASSGSFVDGLN